VALQRQWEISRRYAMFVTPGACLIDERGVIARGGDGIQQFMPLRTEPISERN